MLASIFWVKLNLLNVISLFPLVDSFQNFKHLFALFHGAQGVPRLKSCLTEGSWSPKRSLCNTAQNKGKGKQVKQRNSVWDPVCWTCALSLCRNAGCTVRQSYSKCQISCLVCGKNSCEGLQGKLLPLQCRCYPCSQSFVSLQAFSPFAAQY